MRVGKWNGFNTLLMQWYFQLQTDDPTTYRGGDDTTRREGTPRMYGEVMGRVSNAFRMINGCIGKRTI